MTGLHSPYDKDPGGVPSISPPARRCAGVRFNPARSLSLRLDPPADRASDENKKGVNPQRLTPCS
jgi:hypothetical protein